MIKILQIGSILVPGCIVRSDGRSGAGLAAQSNALKNPISPPANIPQNASTKQFHQTKKSSEKYIFDAFS